MKLVTLALMAVVLVNSAQALGSVAAPSIESPDLSNENELPEIPEPLEDPEIGDLATDSATHNDDFRGDRRPAVIDEPMYEPALVPDEN